MEYKQIYEYISSRRDDITAVVKRLAAIPSVRGEAAPGAPFGIECRRALEETSRVYGEYGYSDSVISDDGYMLTTIGEGEKSIGIFAHADVVPAGDGWCMTEPFVPIERDGVLIGRGVCDNKSAIATSLFAAEAIRELGIPLKSRLVFFTGSNEESGMADIAAYMRDNEPPTVSLVPDASFPVFRGERGILRFYAKSRERLSLIRDFDGGEAFNVVLGKACALLPYSEEILAKLSPICASSERLTLEADGDSVIIRAVGRSHHAAAPDGSLNAAKLIGEALLAAQLLPQPDKSAIEAMLGFMSDNYGSGFGIDQTDELFGRTSAVNGIVRVEDGLLKLGFDVRFVKTIDREEVDEMLADFKAALDKSGFDMELVRNSLGYKYPLDDKLMNAILSTYIECTGNTDAKALVNAGGTYSRALVRAYTVGSRTRLRAPFEMPVGHGFAHQPDEILNLEGHFEAIAIIVKYIIELDRLINQEN